MSLKHSQEPEIGLWIYPDRFKRFYNGWKSYEEGCLAKNRREDKLQEKRLGLRRVRPFSGRLALGQDRSLQTQKFMLPSHQIRIYSS